MMILPILLVGCAEGNVEDARRGEERARERTAVVASLQETRAAERFRTPPATTAEATVASEVTELAIAVQVRSDSAPVEDLAEVPADAETVYAAVRIRNLRDGQVVAAVWYGSDGAQIAESTLTVRTDADEGWVALPLNLGGVREPGEYSVTVVLDGRTLESRTFRIIG